MLNDIKTIKYKKVFGGNFSNNVNIKFAIDDDLHTRYIETTNFTLKVFEIKTNHSFNLGLSWNKNAIFLSNL